MTAPSISVVIPALNAAASLRRSLDCLAELPTAEIMVVDGGSADDTAVIAQAGGARVIAAARGRGPQLAAGAAATTGDWLMFLHADTVLAPRWWRAVEDFIRLPGDQAGYFRFTLDDESLAARRLERRVAWRASRLGLPYGDQGLVITRRFYDALGGYRPLPLMEDVDLVRRIGSRRLVALDHPAVTSAAKFRAEGYRRRSARNLLCLGLYFAGLPPRRLVWFYR